MNQYKSIWRIVVIFCLGFMCLGAISAFAADLSLISLVAGAGKISDSANGDSMNPVMSPDGRYVIFSSAARNLVLTNSSGAVPSPFVHWQNVYLRDLLNASNALVSCNLSGDGGNWNSWPVAISTNGQYVLFESSASDLAPGDTNGVDDVFVRNMVNGVTTLVSVNTNGVSANSQSRSSAMTPDGRYVVFVSSATDLVPNNNTNGISDVFVRDLQAGTTTLVSVGAMTQSMRLPNSSETPVITPDGRYIAFHSGATNLVPANALAGDIYVRDTVGGTTLWASTNARSLFKAILGTTNIVACGPAISDNGRWVSFLVRNGTYSVKGMILQYDLQTGHTTIVTTNAYVPVVSDYSEIKTLNQTPDGRFVAYQANASYTTIYLYDALLGTNILVSANQTDGTPVSGYCDTPVVDATGRYVTFISDAVSGLTTNSSLPRTGSHLYQCDTWLGTAQSIDLDTNNVMPGVGTTFSVSADAHLVVFEALTNSFVANDYHQASDVVLRDLNAGTNTLVSARHPWLPSLAPNQYLNLYSTSISTNARYLAFVSSANNLGPNTTNRFNNVYIWDAMLGTNTLASIGTNGTSALGSSSEPSISGNGRYVAYSSAAKNLVTGDTNSATDVFVYDLQTGSNRLVSARMYGGFGDNNSHAPRINVDGTFVLYYSQAQNLANYTFTHFTDNLFLRDLTLRTNYALTTGMVVSASMTLDGHYVAYVGVSDANKGTNLYVWDSLAARRVYTNTYNSLTNVAISADGRWVAFVSGSVLYAYDLVAKTNCAVATGGFDSKAALQWSMDDRILAFVTKAKVLKADTNGLRDVYLHDFQIGTNILVSRSYATTNAANNISESPSLSPDGRFVAYRSYASDVVPGDTNGLRNLYVYDRITGSTLMITTGSNDSSSPNLLAGLPFFSGDSQTLFFTSFAPGLPGAGFPEYNVIYALNLYSSTNAGTGTGTGTDTNSDFALNLNQLNQTSGQNPLLTWPVISGKFYQVQYKDDLADPVWHNLSSGATQVGNLGQAVDTIPNQSQRFYRVLLSN